MPLADAGYFKPAIYKGTTLTKLPTPVTNLMVRNSWDSRKSKVPLKDGISTAGQSLNEVMIDIQGGAARNEADAAAATSYLTELAMFDRLTAIRAVLDTDDTTRFEFFVYHNSADAKYRKFKSCAAGSFDFSVGDDVKALFTYVIQVVAEDPVIY